MHYSWMKVTVMRRFFSVKWIRMQENLLQAQMMTRKAIRMESGSLSIILFVMELSLSINVGSVFKDPIDKTVDT